MIHVGVSHSDKKITSLEISGHAESGPYGHDLVCAGVSAVSFGLVNAVHELSDVKLDIREEGGSGYLYIGVPMDLPDEQMKEVQLLLQGMLVSLRTIEHEYGDFLQIE